MKTIITAHRAILTRAIIALFVLLSIAAVNPVGAFLDTVATQIEQRAHIENTYAVMAMVQLRNESLPEDTADSLRSIQSFYAGRVSALNEIAAYLRAVGAGEGGGTPIIP